MKWAVVLSVALTLALPAAGLAQGRTNYTGTWIFDSAKSTPLAGRGGGGGGGGAAAVFGAALTTLYINQTEAELTIQNEGTYKLDGSESVNKVPTGESRTKASWVGSNLSLSTTQSQGSIKEVWSVSGSVLTIERTTTTPAGSNTRKLIYNKRP